MATQTRRFRKRWLLLLMPVVLIIAMIGFVLWAGTPTGELMPEAQAALESDALVTVVQDDWLVFTPADIEPTAGLIFYPGGRVQGEAYAPLGKALAENGYLAVIVPMPLNLAILDIDAGNRVIETYPAIEHWAVAGHSLGGSMAARYAYHNRDQLDGLILMAAYPEEFADFSEWDSFVVASIYGTLDGLATVEQVEDSVRLLPSDAQLIPIDGGNHAYFGWYGAQAGDKEATITREAQQSQIEAAVLSVMGSLSD